jgi:hypothetical protein
MKHLTPLALVILFVILAATAPRAQSLAAASAAEAARRAAAPPSRVLTNADVRPAPTPTAPAVPVAVTPRANATYLLPTTIPATEDYWKGRMRLLETQLELDTMLYAGAQAHYRGLNSYVRHDGRIVPVAAHHMFKTAAELDQLAAAIESDKNAVLDLQDEARRANVPPGWLRFP